MYHGTHVRFGSQDYPDRSGPLPLFFLGDTVILGLFFRHERPRVLVGFGVLTVVLSQALPVRLLAQSNTCPDTQEAQQNSLPQMKVVVDAVEFQGESPLSDAERAELASDGDFRGVSHPGLKAQVYEPDLFFSNGLKARTFPRM